jgi:hypothetical protein
MFLEIFTLVKHTKMNHSALRQYTYMYIIHTSSVNEVFRQLYFYLYTCTICWSVIRSTLFEHEIRDASGREERGRAGGRGRRAVPAGQCQQSADQAADHAAGGQQAPGLQNSVPLKQ